MSYGFLADIFIDDQLMFSKRLAGKIGLNEAIFVQQLHYWIKKCGHERDGYKWVYNSSTQWQEEFSFWSLRTIERILKSLKEKHIVEIGNYNQARFDRTNWYRINYEVLNKILGEIVEKSSNNTASDSGELDSAKMAVSHSAKMAVSHSAKMAVSHSAKMTQPIPENNYREYYTENTTENNRKSIRDTLCPSEPDGRAEEEKPMSEVDEIVNEWNKLSELGIPEVKKLSPESKRAKCLRSRLKQYTKSEIIKAIDNIRHSDFLQGKNRTGWIITFDWFVLPNNFPKVLEGNYNNREIENNTTSQQNSESREEQLRRLEALCDDR